MAESDSNAQGPRLAVFITIALLFLITALFAAAIVAANAAGSLRPQSVDAEAYATEVAAAIEGASAAEGEALIEAFQCGVCHVLGNERVAPRFEGIAIRAGERRAPLPSPEYLYESIVSPGAYLVEGYANAMPANFAERMSPEQVGQIIAYLLTQ